VMNGVTVGNCTAAGKASCIAGGALGFHCQ
jgi:hypothetical protein